MGKSETEAVGKGLRNMSEGVWHLHVALTQLADIFEVNESHRYRLVLAELHGLLEAVTARYLHLLYAEKRG